MWNWCHAHWSATGIMGADVHHSFFVISILLVVQLFFSYFVAKAQRGAGS